VGVVLRFGPGTVAPAGRTGGLSNDFAQELPLERGAVPEPCPRPLQRRSKLLEEMTHAVGSAGDPIGEKRAHLRPAKPGAEADRVVDLLDRRGVVVDEPERLAPESLQQAVRDE